MSLLNILRILLLIIALGLLVYTNTIFKSQKTIKKTRRYLLEKWGAVFGELIFWGGGVASVYFLLSILL